MTVHVNRIKPCLSRVTSAAEHADETEIENEVEVVAEPEVAAEPEEEAMDEIQATTSREMGQVRPRREHRAPKRLEDYHID